MPKILIDEKDFTSPGTLEDYANYAVLIPGFAGVSTKVTVKPDHNDVYEFTSAQDFIDTIGLVAPKQTRTITESVDGASITTEGEVYHYGNQMAYELLNLGYPVIYKPIDVDEVEVLATANFWEPFKDKASYDFRFVTHGLLETANVTDDADGTYHNALKRLKKVEEAILVLEDIAEAAGAEFMHEITDQTVEMYEYSNTEFGKVKEEYEGFMSITSNDDGSTSASYYVTYLDAVSGTKNELARLEATIASFAGAGIGIRTINKANGEIANLAKYVADSANSGRGDCVALIELDETAYVNSSAENKAETLIIDAINDMTQINAENGKYCAMTVPSVVYKMSVDTDPTKDPFGGNKKFPGAFHYLACFINSLRLGFAEWYAAAGYTRGVSSYVIDHATVKLGEIAINALEPRFITNQDSDPKFACNVIANFRGNYYLWGNRTAHPLGDKNSKTTGDLVASSFLNIRQLCITIKKQLYVACRRFTFDPNSDTLWVNFVNAIRPTLDAMKADQGVRDYKILKVYTDKKATLKAKIRIIPIEAVEDFDLEVSLEDSFGETAAVVTE